MDAALRLGPRRRRRRRGSRGEWRHTAGGGDRLAELVRAADRLERRGHGSRAGTLRQQRAPALEADVGRRPGPVQLDHGPRRRIDRHGQGLGSINLEEVRRALASSVVLPDSGGPTFAAGEPNPFEDEFTVQLEVSGSGIQLKGIDRRVLSTFNDPTLLPGYPKFMGAGGESATRYANLAGNNEQELIVPGEDGVIHATRPSGTELGGWPVRTQTQQAALGHSGSPGLAALGLPASRPRAGYRRPRRERQPRGDHGRRHPHIRMDAAGKPLAGFPCPRTQPSRPGARERLEPSQVRLSRPRRSPTSKASTSPGRRRAEPRRAPVRMARQRRTSARLPDRADRPGRSRRRRASWPSRSTSRRSAI